MYLYTLNEGFLIKDANSVFKSLQKEGKLNLDFELTNSNIHKIKRQSLIKVK